LQLPVLALQPLPQLVGSVRVPSARQTIEVLAMHERALG
jgi:hypothetical protein